MIYILGEEKKLMYHFFSKIAIYFYHCLPDPPPVPADCSPVSFGRRRRRRRRGAALPPKRPDLHAPLPLAGPTAGQPKGGGRAGECKQRRAEAEMEELGENKRWRRIFLSHLTSIPLGWVRAMGTRGLEYEIFLVFLPINNKLRGGPRSVMATTQEFNLHTVGSGFESRCCPTKVWSPNTPIHRLQGAKMR